MARLGATASIPCKSSAAIKLTHCGSQSLRQTPLQWEIVALVKASNVVAIEALVTDLVGSKNSSEARSPFMLPPDGNSARVRPVARGIEHARRSEVRTPREQQYIALPLMIPLGMEMFDIFPQRAPQGALAKEDHLGQAFLLHRPDPALRIGIQVRAARGQRERLDPT